MSVIALGAILDSAVVNQGNQGNRVMDIMDIMSQDQIFPHFSLDPQAPAEPFYITIAGGWGWSA